MLADRAARKVFQEYHDAVEGELGPFGEFSQITDIGSKSAENATRIAGVFQIWDQGPGDTLRAEYMQAGVAVARWHLNEVARIFADADQPIEVQDAELLSRWFMEVAPQLKRSDGSPLLQCGRMPAWEIGRLGPGPLRNSKGKERREKALRELAAVGVEHVREHKEGERVEIEVNPKLLNPVCKIPGSAGA